MEQAIFGLVGVVVGGLVSGGATYLMARRGERRRERAAVRLVEAELRHGANVAEYVLPPLLKDASAGSPQLVNSMRKALTGLPPPNAWNEYRGQLAELLDARDWYALADSYEALHALQNLDWNELTTAQGLIYQTAIRDALSEFLADLERGAKASAAMSDTTGAHQRPRSTLRTRLITKPSEPDRRSTAADDDVGPRHT
jgi:hypothetical protein